MSAAVAGKPPVRVGVRAAVVKVKIACRDLTIDDDTYRAMMLRLTGQSSASLCTDAQLGVVLDELKAKGWKGKAATRARRKVPTPAAHPLARKARALWISLHQLGEVRDPSEAALEAFAKRQLGIERLSWADPSNSNGLIEALKAMAERAGWSQDVSGVPAAQQINVLKARLTDLINTRRGID